MALLQILEFLLTTFNEWNSLPISFELTGVSWVTPWDVFWTQSCMTVEYQVSIPRSWLEVALSGKLHLSVLSFAHRLLAYVADVPVWRQSLPHPFGTPQEIEVEAKRRLRLLPIHRWILKLFDQGKHWLLLLVCRGLGSVLVWLFRRALLRGPPLDFHWPN